MLETINEPSINLPPLLQKSHVIHRFWLDFTVIYADLEVFPDMLNWIDVWRLCWVWEGVDVVCGAEVFCKLALVNGSTILHDCNQPPLSLSSI